jgi:hypothetical protein
MTMSHQTAGLRLALSALLIGAGCTMAAAQTTVPQGAEHPGAACPPGTMQNAPTVGRPGDGKPLSDQLAESKGVICPPAGVDPQMRQPAPEGGTMKVIPPPDSPGGNPNLQPK